MLVLPPLSVMLSSNELELLKVSWNIKAEKKKKEYKIKKERKKSNNTYWEISIYVCIIDIPQ